MEQPVLGDTLPLRARPAVITVRVDRDASARCELAPDFDVLGIHELDEILHDDVHAVLMDKNVIRK